MVPVEGKDPKGLADL